MDWSLCPAVVLLLCVISSIEAATNTCTLREFVTVGTLQDYQFSNIETNRFTLDNAGILRRINIKTGQGDIISQYENCAVILKNGAAGEVVITFKEIGSNSIRYCWKGIRSNSVLFFVEGQHRQESSLSTDQCITDLAATSSYRMMVKKPLPTDPAGFDNVNFAEVIPSGTYKMTYQENFKAEMCLPNSKAESSVTVGGRDLTFNPCGSTTTSTYKMPFGQKVYVAGYIMDDKLDIVQSSSQTNGGLVVGVYRETSPPFKYYIMRTFETAFTDTTKDTYFEIDFMTTEANAYNPIGFVDTRYVPSNLVNDIMRIRIYSEECKTLQPCRNGGTCVNRWLNYTCLCPPGFSGDQCDITDSECARNTVPGALCNFHGRCRDISGGAGFECVCDPGYTGPKCATQTNCLTDTCKNGGICYDLGFAICTCPSGWTGRFCDKRQVCLSQQPCKNNGICYDVPGGDYFCICPGIFTGKNCDGDRPGPGGPAICQPSLTDELCQNGGVCIDFKCECGGYYVGKYCEDVNRWFIAAIVMIVLIAVILIVTLIVCCYFCARGRAVGQAQATPQKQYDPFASPFPQPPPSNIGFSTAPSNAGFAPVGFIQTTPNLDNGVFVQSF